MISVWLQVAMFGQGIHPHHCLVVGVGCLDSELSSPVAFPQQEHRTDAVRKIESMLRFPVSQETRKDRLLEVIEDMDADVCLGKVEEPSYSTWRGDAICRENIQVAVLSQNHIYVNIFIFNYQYIVFSKL